jgi:hemolysin activation/secretion protein
MTVQRKAARRLACGAATLVSAALFVSAAVAQAPEPAPADAGPTFDVDAYDITGATLLPQAAVEAAVYPHLGPARTPADIEAARAALQQAYASRGFNTVEVTVPEQTLDEIQAARVVQIAVTEVKVGEVRVTGARFSSPEAVRRGTPALAPGEVPNLQTAERQIAALNQTPDRQVAPLLTPGKVPGTVDVELAVTDERPIHGALELNNDHAAFTKDLRLNANIRHSNLWGRGHTAFFGYTVAPERRDDVEVFQGSYLAPFAGTPWTLQLSGYDSNSRLATLGGTNVLGLGYQFNVRGIYTFPSTATIAHRLSLGFDYNHASLFTFSVNDDGELVPEPLVPCPDNDPTCVEDFNADVDYYTLIADYSISRVTEAQTTSASVTLAANLRGSVSGDSEFLDSRFDARANWIKLNATFDHVRNLPRGFVGVIQGGAQIADQPLVSREQFAIGGLGSIRGYLQASALGDSGAYGNAELRSPLLFPRLAPWVDEWRLYAFGDAGYVRTLSPLPEQDADQGLYSLGLGTRFTIYGRLDGDLLVGVPLEDAFDAEVGQPYGFFTLRTEF